MIMNSYQACPAVQYNLLNDIDKIRRDKNKKWMESSKILSIFKYFKIKRRCEKMNKKFHISITIITLIIALSITAPTVISYGEEAGVLPAVISLDNALKGEQYYKRNIRIINGNDNATTFKLITEGQIKNWIKFYKIDDENLENPIKEITITGVTKERINVVFQIPEIISNGLYEGNIYVETINSEDPKLTGVNIRLPISVFIEVIGDQILAGEVLGIETTDVEVGQELTFEIDFKNTGNVIATPQIIINISREGYPIDSIIYKDAQVDVDSGKFIIPNWNTFNLEPGKYIANITVILGDNILHQEDVYFEIYPRGTLTRKGEIIDFYYEGDLSIENTIKIFTKFKNTGAVELPAKFYLEVYKNNNLAEVLESSEEPIVQIGESYLFSTYLKIKEEGKYYLEGYVVYGNNKTNTVNLSFNVEKPKANVNVTQFGIMIGVICFAFIGLIYVKKNANHKKSNNKTEKHKKSNKKYKK